MSYETTGAIKLINDIQTFSSGFEKREFVITTDEKYPQDIKLELIKDDVVKTDQFKVGDNVKVLGISEATSTTKSSMSIFRRGGLKRLKVLP